MRPVSVKTALPICWRAMLMFRPLWLALRRAPLRLRLLRNWKNACANWKRKWLRSRRALMPLAPDDLVHGMAEALSVAGVPALNSK